MQTCSDTISELTNQLRAELAHARIPTDLEAKLTKEVALRKSLAAKLEDANDELIYSKRENEKLALKAKQLADENQSIRAEMLILRKEFEQFKKSNKSNALELEAYRKQTGTDPTNARRIAIGLARHCLELSNELAKLRENSNNEPKTVPPISVTAWGLDDDGMFD